MEVIKRINLEITAKTYPFYFGARTIGIEAKN